MSKDISCQTLFKIARGVGLKNPQSLNSSGKGFPYPRLFLGGAVLAMNLSFPTLVRAEGTIDLIETLTPATSYRPFLDARTRTDTVVGIARKTIIKVYANPGETINLASSVVGISQGKIQYRDPNGTSGTCDLSVGKIADPAAEANRTYTPCQVLVGATQGGVWEIDFVSPNPTTQSDNLTPILTTSNWFPNPTDINSSDDPFIASWDVTVTKPVNGVDVPQSGRVYTNFLPLNMGNTNNAVRGLLNSIVYIQTDQGYVYRVNLNELDPVGFVFFANNNGFKQNGIPSFKSTTTVRVGSNIELPPGVTVQKPGLPDTATDTTYKIFFNHPDPTLPETANTPSGSTWLRPAIPQPIPQITNFQFLGKEGTPNQAGSGLGGTFSFNLSNSIEPGDYAVTIDVNGDGEYGNANDRILQGVTQTGANTIVWDGKDGNGVDVPPNALGYQPKLTIFIGDVHFPLADAENARKGLIIERLQPNTPPGVEIVEDSRIYYNDAGLPTKKLDGSGNSPPKPISALNGVSSSSGAHIWGDGQNNGFGDETGIDTWTSLVAPIDLPNKIIVKSADLQIDKSHSTPNPVIFPGPITFTIDVTNANTSNFANPSAVTAVPVTDTLPPGVTFTAANVSCGVTAGTGSCGAVNVAGQNLAVPVSLNPNSKARITIQAQLTAAAANPLTNTATVTRNNDVSDLFDNDGQSLDNRPNGTESDPYTVALVAENPLLGVAKQAGGATKNSDGTFNVPYTVVVENKGNVPLSNVQVTEDLATTFTGAGGFSIAVAPAVTGSITAANPAFNGTTNQNLLAGTQPLAVGAKATITFTVKVTPAGNLGPYNNTAVGNGTAPSGTTATDQSENGANTDPDNDGNPKNNNTPTPVVFPEEPILGVAKSAGTPVNNNNGTFTVPYTVVVSNLGNVALNNVQLTEDIFGGVNSTFNGAANAIIVSPPTVVSGPLTAFNPSFNGNSDKNVLAGNQTLGFGQSATISFSVQVTPAGKLGTYNNLAVATGTTPGGVVKTDTSTNGGNVDPDNDKNPGNNSVPTPVNFPETPVLGVAKAAGDPVDNGDGSFNIPYTVTVQNLGNVALSQVQVVENLNSTFAAPATFSIQGTPISSIPNLTVNPAFDGKTNTNLLTTATSNLPFGGLATISFTVKVTPTGNLGPYNNNAVGSGRTPGGTTVTDNSVDGNSTDPNGDGNPNEQSPTVVRLEERPSIGLAKQAGTIVNNGDGTYTVPYTIAVQNFGNIALNQVQVVENLTGTFPAPTTFVIDGTPTSSIPGLVINPAFNGTTNTNLLNANSTLPLGATATLNFKVKITPNGNLGPFNNSASATGSTPGGKTVTDDSVNGGNPDPNGNKNPTDDTSPTTILLTEKPVLGVAKAAGAPVNNQNGTYTVPYTVIVSNLGDVPVRNVQITENIFGDANSTFIRHQLASPKIQ